jgi:hypothetical protein
MLGRFKKIAPEIREDWTRKVMVVIEHPKVPGIWARFITNHADAMRVEVHCALGRFTPALIEKLGIDPVIRHLSHHDQVQFWLQKSDQCDQAQLEHLIRESIESLKGE